MKAWWQLIRQMFVRAPALTLMGIAFWVFALYCAMLWLHGDSHASTATTASFGFATWAWHVGLGLNLRSLCVPESFLLPHFRRRLLEYGAIDMAIWVVLPTLLALMLQLPHILLIASGLLMMGALGLTIGCNPRLGIFIWPLFIVLGWAPASVSQLIKIGVDSPLTPVLALAITAGLLKLSITALLRIEDRETSPSPMENNGLDRDQMRSMPGDSPRTGGFIKRVNALYDRTSQRAMERALIAYKRHPDFSRRMVLVRRLLLPHDNPEAIVLRIVTAMVFVCLYVFAVMYRQHFQPEIIGAYAVLLGIARFPQLSLGLVRMRPNMADLYLTLAPETRAEYQKTISDALLVLIPVSVLTALVYTSLGIALMHAADPWHMLFVATIVALSGSLAALALHLIGPEGKTGRAIANFTIMMGVMAVYWGGYWLVGTAGYVMGGGVLAVVTLSFSFGVWFAAQREYQQRSPRFDAPIG
jgi:hypothetical protein